VFLFCLCCVTNVDRMESLECVDDFIPMTVLWVIIAQCGLGSSDVFVGMFCVSVFRATEHRDSTFIRHFTAQDFHLRFSP
jgi:hypothetical protein